MMEPLDLSPLERAVQRLDEGLSRYQQNVSDLQIRDGLIQRFEFTYEVSHKTLKKFLMLVSASPELFADRPFSDLIRTGNEYNLLLGNWADWKKYRESREKTSHTYDEPIAMEVVQSIPAFLEEARYLLEQLQKKIGKM
ncbi:MAG: nucleotidyltransferase substrate binding protein [Magnetococcales bacterium]|nr:nucleotidyltransferase substrate binding protein [Magnetococcales bacterium]